MDIYSITVDETSGNNEENINAKEAIFELVLDNVIVTYEVIFTENIEQFEVVVSDIKVTYIVEPSTTFFSSGIGDAPDEQLYCRRNGQWVALAPVQSLELGNLHTNAYYGDLGKIAYDHSQATGNPHQLSFSGLSNKPTTVQGYGITDIPAWALSVSKPSYTTSEVTEAENLYFTESRVLSTIINGYEPTDGNVNSSDSILSAINKLGNNKHLPLTLGSANGLTLDGQQLSLALASSSATGSLSYTDWNIFNNKLSPSLMGIANGLATLGSDSKIPLSQIPVSLLGQVNYKGLWDASTGLPSLPSIPTSNGDYYIVSVSGSTTMGSVNEWKVGDWLIANGSVWGKVDNTDAVSSVNGYVGTVILNKSDIGLSNVSNELQWSVSNHPTTTIGYGLPNYPTTLPASDVYTWAKESVKPSYIWTEIGNRPIVLSQFSNDLGNYGGFVTGTPWTSVGYWYSSNHPTTLGGYGITDAIQNQQSVAQAGGLWVSQLIKTSYGITVLHTGNDNPSLAPFINFQDPSFSVSNSISMNSIGGLSVNNYQAGVGTVKTFTISKEGNITSLGYYTGTQYKVIGGTSSQYLKADGSLDANTYQPLGTAINTGNIGGQSVNYANVSGNATNWSGYELDFDQAVSVNRLIAFDSSDNTFRVADGPSVKSWLGLGSSAYTNTNDHIQNQYSSAQSANMWISGTNRSAFQILGTNATATGYLSRWGNGTNEGFLDLNTGGAIIGSSTGYFQIWVSNGQALQLNTDKSATFASTVNATQLQSTVSTGTAPLTVNSTTMVSNLNAQYLNGFTHNSGLLSERFNGDLNTLGLANSSGLFSIGGVLTNNPNAETYGALLATWNGDISTQLYLSYNGNMHWRKSIGTTYTGSVWRTIYDSGNLTNTLTTNYLPKWNGTSMVNSLISDDGISTINLGNNTIIIGDRSSELYYSKINYNLNTSGNADLGYLSIKIHNWPDEEFDAIHITGKGNTKILSSTQSTSPTTGALVTPGGIGVGGNLNTGGTITASNFILSSDRTLKTNIQPITKDYSKLNLVSFNFRNNLEELRFGTIAQDLLSSGYSEFVTGDKEGEYKVKYIDLIIAKLASTELRIKQLEDKYGSR